MWSHRLPRAAARLALAATFALASSPFAGAQKLVYTATLDGAQQVPPTTSTATGSAVIVIDRDKNTFNFIISISGLGSPETGAYIQGFAEPGVNAPVLFSLPLGALKMGSWSFAEADELSVITGLTYLNVCTINSPGGEIRGQVALDTTPTQGLYGDMDGAQEVPPSPSTALGTSYFAIDTAANTLRFNISYSGLGSAETLAIIHGPAPAGANAGALFNLPAGNPKFGTWNYPEAQEVNILSGLTYVNIHTALLPAGEIRGQILPVLISTPYCKGKVNSKGCVPAIGSSGTPSAAAGPDNYMVTCTNALNKKVGLVFFGTRPNKAPLLGGTLCVLPPFKRAGAQSSGGNPPPDDCSGNYSFHFSKAFLAANVLIAGDLVYCEWWMRDPAQPDGTSVGFSNALQFIVQP